MMTIFSENPENDLWRELMQFTYKANIKRYFDKKGLKSLCTMQEGRFLTMC